MLVTSNFLDLTPVVENVPPYVVQKMYINVTCEKIYLNHTKHYYIDELDHDALFWSFLFNNKR